MNYGPHHNLSRHQVLAKYSTALKQLRAFAEKNYDMRPLVFDNYVLFQYFQQQRSSSDESSTGSSRSDERSVGMMSFSPMNYLKMELLNHILDRRRQILYYLFFVLMALLCFFVYRHETATEHSAHSIVYPGMRIWRRMTLPLIQRFPRLTELYDESCLMGNPFFQVDGDGKCFPCAHVDGVMDLTKYMGNGINENDDTGGSNDEDSGGESPLSKLHLEYVPFVFKVIKEASFMSDDSILKYNTSCFLSTKRT